MIEFVTLSGIDDDCNLDDLAALCRTWQGRIELAFLLSPKRVGSPRYASPDTVRRIGDARLAPTAIHCCGNYARELLEDGIFPLSFDPANLRRIQINSVRLDPPAHTRCVPAARTMLSYTADLEWIFQTANADFRGSVHHLRRGLDYLGIKTAILYDASGGQGATPAQWPESKAWAIGTSEVGTRRSFHVGYAGGLSPETLPVELPRILAASDGCPIWLDMESGLRDADDRFSVERADACMRLIQPHFTKFRD